MKKKLKWYFIRWQVIAALLGLIGIFYWWWNSTYYPMGSGPAGPQVNPGHFSKTWTTQKTVLIGIGDSITWGFGASLGHSYFDLLIKNDDKKYPEMQGLDLSSVLPDLKYYNYAVNFSTSQDHLIYQVPAINSYDKNTKGIVVITTGGNDLIHNYGLMPPQDGALYGATYQQALPWAENFKKRLENIIESITKKFSGSCEIFLANIYDPTDDVGDIENTNLSLPAWPDGLMIHALFNQIIADTALSYSNVHLVNIYSEFLGHGIHCRDKKNANYRRNDPYYWYYINLEDPNDRGYDAIRRLFLIKIAEAF